MDSYSKQVSFDLNMKTEIICLQGSHIVLQQH